MSGNAASTPAKEELEALLKEGAARLNALRLPPEKILKVLGPLENQPGGESRVFRVEWTGGEGVLRIDFSQVLRDRAVMILLQSYLGRFGLAPEVLGLLEGAELKALLSAHPAFSGLRSPWSHIPDAPPWSAMLMGVVEDGWNILQPERSSAAPSHAASWDRAGILGQVAAIQDAVTRLDIQIVDPQFLVSKRGRVWMIDLEDWYFIDSQGAYWAYDGKAPRRLDVWVDRKNIKNDFLPQVRAALEKLA
jgi:hypothetical protein